MAPPLGGFFNFAFSAVGTGGQCSRDATVTAFETCADPGAATQCVNPFGGSTVYQHSGLPGILKPSYLDGLQDSCGCGQPQSRNQVWFIQVDNSYLDTSTAAVAAPPTASCAVRMSATRVGACPSSCGQRSTTDATGSTTTEHTGDCDRTTGRCQCLPGYGGILCGQSMAPQQM